MFHMTARAHAVIRSITSHPRLGPDSGLRISARDRGEQALGVGTAVGPKAEDEVIEHDGARVYVDRQALDQVRGSVLDTRTERTGRVHFVVKAPPG